MSYGCRRPAQLVDVTPHDAQELVLFVEDRKTYYAGRAKEAEQRESSTIGLPQS